MAKQSQAGALELRLGVLGGREQEILRDGDGMSVPIPSKGDGLAHGGDGMTVPIPPPAPLNLIGDGVLNL